MSEHSHEQNVNAQDKPIFYSILGAHWDALPKVLMKHYMNRPYSQDVVTVQGIMSVRYTKWFSLVAPLCRYLQVLAPYRGEDIPVTVKFRSYPDSRIYSFDRTFYFDKQNPVRFQSYMLQVKDNDVIEIMRFGIAWRMKFILEGNKLVFQHNGYVWRVFGINVRLPLTFLLGKGYAHEIALSDDEFDMDAQLTHPLLGLVYQYKGRFRLVDNDDD